jgi:Tfp pilus assembly protein PilX
MRAMSAKHTKYHKGAVSLFIVIFTTLLMAVITVGFIQLMTKDQQQATANDLSRSAYDSAQAGIEDAKRLLLLDQSCDNGTADSATINCLVVASALASRECNTLAAGGVVSETNNETIIQQSVGDNAAKLDQAYTCVKVVEDTDDYLGKVDAGGSVVIPLNSMNPFNKVVLSWFEEKDIVSSTNSRAISFPGSGSSVNLPRDNGTRWRVNTPSLMRAQLIQVGRSFQLSDFDGARSGGRGSANTLFLYPASSGATSKNFGSDSRQDPLAAPQPIACRSTISGGGYACSVELTLPDPEDGSAADRRAFLHLAALYNASHFKIELKDSSGSAVKFAGVQPEVDSTGRANDMFRRVVSRVELRSNMTYPRAAVDLYGNLCKNFSVTTIASDYVSSCTP